MIARTLAALLAASALAACEATTPSHAAAERALRDYIAMGVPNPGDPNLFGARVMRAGDCVQMGAEFRCPVEVQDGSHRRPLVILLKREGRQWRVRSVADVDGWP